MQDLEKLKYINVENSDKLANIPDLSRANLKILKLTMCKSLVEAPPLKFQQVTTREESLVRSSVFFSHDPYRSVNNYLLDFCGCFNLKTLSTMSGNIKHMHLCHTAIEELHSSIFSINTLVSIDLTQCPQFKSLPGDICKLKSLEYLNLGGCSSFNNLPAKLPESLIELNLSETAIEQVQSSSFECLPNLKILIMNKCKMLETLPSTIGKLKSLKRLGLSQCPKLNEWSP